MSQYVILIYENPAFFETMPPEKWGEVIDAHNTFTGRVSELGGTLTGGGALAPVATATTIRRGTAVAGGPFVQSEEALLGYYVVEARNIDHAVEIAQLCPASGGGVEVRPLVDPTVRNPF